MLSYYINYISIICQIWPLQIIPIKSIKTKKNTKSWYLSVNWFLSSKGTLQLFTNYLQLKWKTTTSLWLQLKQKYLKDTVLFIFKLILSTLCYLIFIIIFTLDPNLFKNHFLLVGLTTLETSNEFWFVASLSWVSKRFKH